MSENSFESEWVQNEAARAKRKGKPFFPLLLSGDAWLSVEATQYIDVNGEILPPKEFFRHLEEFVEKENLKLSYNPDYITSERLTYKNPIHNFSFKYPFDGEIVRNEENHVSIEFPVTPNTDLRQKYLTIDCIESEKFLVRSIQNWGRATINL